MKKSQSPILARPESGGGGLNPQSAFTLAEMLVVIGVVGILSALILPALSGAKARAYDTTCKSNLHQWEVAWMNYTEENNGYFSTGTSVWWARGEWLAALQSAYQKKPDLLLCPVATHRRGQGIKESQVSDNNTNAVDWGGPTTAWAVPLPDSASPGRKIISSYGLNLWVYNPPANVTNIQSRATDWNWRKLDVPHPAQVPLFLDAMWRGGGPREIDFPPPFNGAWEGYNSEFCHFAIARHGNGVNVLFFDGSVRHVRTRELWGLQWNRHYDANIALADTVFPDWMK